MAVWRRNHCYSSFPFINQFSIDVKSKFVLDVDINIIRLNFLNIEGQLEEFALYCIQISTEKIDISEKGRKKIHFKVESSKWLMLWHLWSSKIFPFYNSNEHLRHKLYSFIFYLFDNSVSEEGYLVVHQEGEKNIFRIALWYKNSSRWTKALIYISIFCITRGIWHL